jgi:hypothetical protein
MANHAACAVFARPLTATHARSLPHHNEERLATQEHESRMKLPNGTSVPLHDETCTNAPFGRDSSTSPVLR